MEKPIDIKRSFHEYVELTGQEQGLVDAIKEIEIGNGAMEAVKEISGMRLVDAIKGLASKPQGATIAKMRLEKSLPASSRG